MHSQARKVATLSPPHTPRSLYLCAIFSIYSVVSSVPHTPRYIYAWLFFSVCSVNPFVPHTHTTYICGHSSQSVALFPPIPHSICVSLLSHRQRIKYTLALRSSRIRSAMLHPYAAVALLVIRVQRVFRADKGVLPSVSPTHAAHFCMFINVLLHVHQHTAAYSSICGIHWVTPQYCLHTSKTALLKPSLFTLKLLPFRPQFLNFCPLTSFHFTLKFCSLRPQTFSISFSNFRSFILTLPAFRLLSSSLFIFLQLSNFPTLQPSKCVSVFSPNLSHIYRKSILPFLSHYTLAPISCNLTNLSPITAHLPHLNRSSALQKHLSTTPKPYFLLRHISNKYKRKMY